MKHESLRRMVWGTLSALLLAAWMATAGAAQEPPSAAPARPTDPPAAGAAKDAKAPRRRLPAYFGQVVSDKQRTQIYEIQAKYHEQIEKLKSDLETLTAKRDSEVEQVLSDEQRTEIAKLKSARRARSSGSPDGDAANGEK